jgi:serine/threonine-protein kinase PknG
VKCAQPGCTGEIVDGYCDACGMAPARVATTPSSGGTSGPPAQGPSTSTPTSYTTTLPRSATTGARPSTRNRLGAGLVAIPPVPYRDPSEAVLTNPMVQENRRFCATCDEPVGRSRGGAPGRASGFCRKCGSAFSFEPKLKSGDLVAGQYEVVGCLAHGGMGWVYLARDRNVSDRWVVLKGLLNTGDRDATAAALAERRFLAQVEHPNIVKIFNFVQHESSGYIVMEYVGGESLKQILTARREANGGEADPLPLPQAIAYMLEILPALGHLHDTGLLFCDFKLDNVIQTRHSLKLIDLGGVYRIDDPSSAIFGTVGYQAPEIASAGPSISSDLFTVARTLAVLSVDFRGYQGTYRFTLPPQDSVPLLERHDSLYRFLLKGTAPNPDDRFRSAEEMADQLHGVLREVVAELEGRAVPAPSTLFTSALRTGLERPDWRILPRAQVASDDPSAGYLATIAATDPHQLMAQLRAAPERTVEVDLRLAAAMIDAGELADAEELLATIEAAYEWEWRAAWYRGVLELARGGQQQALQGFTTVYHAVPGELAPKLALGLACEWAGDIAQAARWYETVSRTDPSVTSASFGLARCRLELGDRAGALAAYERVPDSSSGHVDAQTARIRCLGAGTGLGAASRLDELRAAGSILQALPVEAETRERLTAELLEAALELVAVNGTGNGLGNGDASLLGHRLADRDLRFGLERSYRALARRASSRSERIRLVDQANRARPRTWT